MFGGLFSGVGAAVTGGLLNQFFADRSFDKSSNLSWQMWNAQNAYNDPSAVMARYKRAGLNPHLIYGHMPMAGGPAVVNHKQSAVDFNPLIHSQLQNMRAQLANQVKDLQLKDQNLRVTDAGIKSTEAATALATANYLSTIQKMKNDQRSADDAHRIAENAYNEGLLDLGFKRGEYQFYRDVLGTEKAEDVGEGRHGMRMIGKFVKDLLFRWLPSSGNRR